MAFKPQLLHFPTKASYEKERTRNENAGTLEQFKRYISFVDEGPTLYTWGVEYNKIEDTLDSSSTNASLSANMGRELNKKIEALSSSGEYVFPELITIKHTGLISGTFSNDIFDELAKHKTVYFKVFSDSGPMLVATDWALLESAEQGVVGYGVTLNGLDLVFIMQKGETGSSYMVIGDSHFMYRGTYEDILKLQDKGELIPGKYYCITDYDGACVEASTLKSAKHSFNIIIQALDSTHFSEDARAVSNSSYFANNNLSAWKLKYNFNNDYKYSWGKPWVLEKPNTWSSNWGVFGTSNTTSLEGTSMEVDGKTFYLYAPEYRGNYLEGKPLYLKNNLTFIESPEELVYTSNDYPYIEEDDGGSDGSYSTTDWTDVIIDVRRKDGTLVTTLEGYHECLYDTRDEAYTYSIYLNPNPEYKDGVYVYTIDYVSDWWDNFIGGKIEEFDKTTYTTDTNTLYYAFTSPLSNSAQQVDQLYSEKDNIICYPDWDDTIIYTPATAKSEGTKGIIYSLTDEFGNSAPFDFKNLQHQHNGEWYYTFNRNGIDWSLTETKCNNNIIEKLTTNSNSSRFVVPTIIFNPNADAGTIVGNRVGSEIKKMYLNAKVINNNIWKPLGNGSYITDFYTSINGNFVGNIFTGYLPTIDISGDFTNFGNNVVDLVNAAITSGGLTVKSLCWACKFDLSCANTWCTIETGSYYFSNIHFYSLSRNDNYVPAHLYCPHVFYKSNLEFSNTLTVEYSNTTSTSNGLSNVNINALLWNSEGTISIPKSFPVSSPYRLNISKNSDGVIKYWCDADLIA